MTSSTSELITAASRRMNARDMLDAFKNAFN